MTTPRPSTLARYEDLFLRLTDPALLLDLETYQVLEVNASLERLFEKESADLIGGNLLQWVYPEQKQAMERALRVARRRYYPRQFESVLISPAGRSIQVEVSACVLKLSEEKEILQMVVRDISHVKEVESQASQYLEKLEAANKKLEELSIKDEMTGLFNFRHFSQELKKEHERSDRYVTPYAIVFCDVDHFKKYNDQNGHQAGDDVLRGVGKIIQEEARNTDLPARYGGEEFVVLCPGVTSDGAKVLAERIRKAVASHPFPHAEKQPLGHVSISVGVASFPHDATGMKELLEAADQALYQSKHSGRDRVTLFKHIHRKEKKVA